MGAFGVFHQERGFSSNEVLTILGLFIDERFLFLAGFILPNRGQCANCGDLHPSPLSQISRESPFATTANP